MDLEYPPALSSTHNSLPIVKSPLDTPSQLLSPPFPPEVTIILNLTRLGKCSNCLLLPRNQKERGGAGPKEESLGQKGQREEATDNQSTPGIPGLCT